MSKSISPSHDLSLANGRQDESGASYLRRLDILRAKKQFPEFDPEYVLECVAQQRAERMPQNNIK